MFKSSSKCINCVKYFCHLYFWRKKSRIWVWKLILVLKTCCCSQVKIYSFLALQSAVSLYFSVASAYLAVPYFRGQGVFWTVTDFSPVFPEWKFNPVTVLSWWVKSNEIDTIVLNSTKVSLSDFNFICCVKCMGFISGHIGGDS